jgi:hypothetical protein
MGPHRGSRAGGAPNPPPTGEALRGCRIKAGRRSIKTRAGECCGFYSLKGEVVEPLACTPADC